MNGYAAAVEAVTAEDVKRVASAYLDARNRTVATLIPEQSAQGEQQ